MQNLGGRANSSSAICTSRAKLGSAQYLFAIGLFSQSRFCAKFKENVKNFSGIRQQNRPNRAS
jgi:hypothetical protein